MSKKRGVFICPSCQSVVQSEARLEEGVVCGECLHEFGLPETVSPKKEGIKKKDLLGKGLGGRKRTVIVRDVTSKKAAVAARQTKVEREQPVVRAEEGVEEAHFSRDEETILADGSREVRRRKKRPLKERNLKLVLFLAGWFSLVAIIFTLSRLLEEEEPSAQELLEQAAFNEKTIKNEVFRRFSPEVIYNFRAFIAYPENVGREQFIDESSELALPFSKHYELNPFVVPRSAIRVKSSNVLKLSEESFGIETVWEDQEGNQLGAVHLWDGEGWKLDWENYVPYSAQSWSLFRAEIGKREGQFRLLVRKRGSDDESERFSLSFYRPPVLYEDADEFRVSESPEVELETQSELGQRFLKLWNDHKAGKVPFGSILGKSLDPSNYLRVNVVLAWEKNDLGESVMVLKDILGVLWFGDTIQRYYQASLAGDGGGVEAE